MVQKRISIVHGEWEVEVLQRLLDGIAYALLEAHEIIQYDNKWWSSRETTSYKLFLKVFLSGIILVWDLDKLCAFK